MIRNRATLIIKTKEGILVGRHIFNWKYSLLGGGLRFREKMEDAAKRELKEETGLKIVKIKHLFDFNFGFHRHKVFSVEVKGKDKFNWEIRKTKHVNKENYTDSNLNEFSRKILDRYFTSKGF